MPQNFSLCGYLHVLSWLHTCGLKARLPAPQAVNAPRRRSTLEGLFRTRQWLKVREDKSSSSLRISTLWSLEGVQIKTYLLSQISYQINAWMNRKQQCLPNKPTKEAKFTLGGFATFGLPSRVFQAVSLGMP